MQIVFWTMFITICGVAIFFWIAFEKTSERVDELESRLYELKHLKGKSQLVMIGDYVEEYKKGGNVYTSMRKISDLLIENEKELAE